MDDFEQRLQQLPGRRIPPGWREDILRRVAGAAEHRAPAANLPPATLAVRLASVFWPCPQAWAGLAAVWILLLVVDFSLHDAPPQIAQRAAKASPEFIFALEQQKRLRAELVGSLASPEADRPKSTRPRSERCPAQVVV
jgi:hypothetical protein